MRGTWIKTSVLMLGLSLAGAGLQAQQAPANTSADQQTVQNAASCQHHGAKLNLNLSPDQKKQMRQLRLSARDQAAIIRNDQSLSAEQKQSKLKELRGSTREKMISILTPDQQKMVAERRAERKAKFAAKLGLTADQQAKLKDLFHSTRQQRQAVLSNTSLSNDQKLAQLQQIREDAKSQLATILSPEQLQKLHQLRRQHHRMMMHNRG